jgi:VWFA-related protein
MPRAVSCAAVVAAAVAVVLVHVPAAQQTQPPTFTVAVESVEVDARVVDANGDPISDLRKADFQLFEDGVEHDVATFSIVNLPLPAVATGGTNIDRAVEIDQPDVSTNIREEAGAGRIYLILLDDRFIAGTRTPVVRRLMREFIERHIAPNDLVAVMSGGRSLAFQNFTSDKNLLIAAVDRIFGDKMTSPTIQRLLSIEYKASTSTVGGVNPTSEPIAPQDIQLSQVKLSGSVLARAVRFMSGMGGRSKAVVLVSEGSDLDTLTNTEGLPVFDVVESALGVAMHGNVPVYAVDPRGLTSLAEESIQVGPIHPGDSPLEPLRNELLRSQQRLRNLAEDTGGFATTGMNNLEGAFDRIVQATSSYYALSYYPKNVKHDGRYHKISVKVNRPGARVVARNGYTAADARARSNAALSGPPGTSKELRETLHSALPQSGLGLSMTAAAFRDRGAKASVAVVIEASGTDLALTERNEKFGGPFEVVVAALGLEGDIRDGETRQMQFDLPRQTFERVRSHGFRWLSRLSLKPGVYQIRVGAVSGRSKRGSAWYDLVVPDFADGDLAMSHILAASERAFQAPTFKPDPLLRDALPGPPTTSRTFAAGDTLTVFAEFYDNRVSQPHDVEATLIIRSIDGRELVRRTERRSNIQLRESRGLYAYRAELLLANAPPGRYVLVIEGHRTDHAETIVSRTMPFQIVR